MKTIEQIEKELDDKLPRDLVSVREGGRGKQLSYVEGWAIIDRLNKIFGPLHWNKEITEVREVVNTTNKGEKFPAYLVKVRLEVRVVVDKENDRFGGTWCVKEAYGYGSDKSSQNAHELAIKEAVTDALKVAAKDLGMSLGLALYDKTQEFVDDGEPATPPTPSTSPPRPLTAGSPVSALKSGPAAAQKTEREKLIDLIGSTSRVIVAKKLKNTEELIGLLKTHGVERKEDLTLEAAKGFLTQLEGLLK